MLKLSIQSQPSSKQILKPKEKLKKWPVLPHHTLHIFGAVNFIEMDNRGEVSKILSGITFDRNNIFNAEKSYLYVIFRTISSFFPHQKYCPYQKLCHSILRSVTVSTLPKGKVGTSIYRHYSFSCLNLFEISTNLLDP